MCVTHRCDCSSPSPPPVRERSGHYIWNLIPLSHPSSAHRGMTPPALEEHGVIHTTSKPELKGHACKKLDPIYEIKLDGGFAGQLGDSSD